MSRLLIAILTAGCLAASVTAQEPPAPVKPAKTAVAPTAAQLERLRAGAQLHDQGKFDDAIAIFEAILKETPDCAMALYELANSQMAKQDFPKALETATRGTDYDSPGRGQFYILIGSVHDEMGAPDRAVDAYKRGLAIAPSALLYFNLAITLERLKNDDEAVVNLKQAALINANHASTQRELGLLFMRRGQLSQGLLALTRFLILEPTSPRARDVYAPWLKAWMDSAVADAAGTGITVTLKPQSGATEGNFTQQDLLIGIGRTAAIVQSAGKTQAQQLVDQLEGWFRTLASAAQSGGDRAFAWTYYAPYFAEIQKRGYVEPMVYWVSQGSNTEGVREWISNAANRQRGNEFAQWSQQYAWPKR